MSEATGPEGSLTLGERLGQGAVATVDRVHGPGGRVYAGKRLHASHEHDEAAVARFAQEAQLLEGLTHENLVKVYGRVSIDGRDVLLMELVEGPALDQRIAREAPLAATVVRRLGRDIAAGLHCAHEAGIVHRDLKPSNIMLAGGEVPKIADFGMARASSLEGVEDSALTILGTPDYMAPECLDPLAVDARADLYALGCILFEMLSGKAPYTAATPLGVLAAHRDQPIPELPSDTPPALRELVQSLLAKSPGDRPQAAASVRDALAAMAEGDGSTALARTSTTAAAASRDRCVTCGAPLVVALGVCTDCNSDIPHVEPGDHTVLVTGPGEPGDKLDAALRGHLQRWLEDTPSLGLIPTNSLTKKIPRVPFPVAEKISERSAASIARALKALGLEAATVRGGPMALPAMRKKTKTLLGRAALIALSTSGGLWQTGWLVVVFLMAIVVATGTMVVMANRRVTRNANASARALAPSLRAALERTRRSLPAIEERRHRQGLRGVLTRVVDLAQDVPADDSETAEELTSAAEAALAAASELDTLDRRLAALGRNNASEEGRALLHTRDIWASRLLSLTAALDVLASRRAAAKARGPLAEDEDALARLSAHVDALQEVQSL